MNKYFLRIFAVAIITSKCAATNLLPTYQERVVGAVIGATVGDALGRVTEFITTTDTIKARYRSNGLTSFTQFKSEDWIDGQALYTDDTVMALINLKWALHYRNEKVPSSDAIHDLARQYGELFGRKYKVDPYYDIRAHGPTNIAAGEKLWQLLQNNNCRLEDLTASNNVAKEGGCGSVMRAWPIGLVFYKQEDRKRCFKFAAMQSMLTHRHPIAINASMAMAAGIAAAIRGESVGQIVGCMVSEASHFGGYNFESRYKPDAVRLSDLEEKLSPRLIAQDKLLTGDMIQYAYHMALEGKQPAEILGTHNRKQKNYRSPDGFLLGWAADEAVAAAVYIFARHPNDLDAAIAEGVNTPGDSDSIASLAGALVGAYSGIKSLKMDYSNLENREQLLKICHDLVQAQDQITPIIYQNGRK